MHDVCGSLSGKLPTQVCSESRNELFLTAYIPLIGAWFREFWRIPLRLCRCAHRICYFSDCSVFGRLRPMTMETRCSKVIFPNYSKKKPAEDTLVPPLWRTREKNIYRTRIICSRGCTRRNLRFHVENCNTLIKNSPRDDRPSIST